MNPSSGQPNFGQNFNQGQNPNVNSGQNPNFANQNFANPNVAASNPEVAPLGNMEHLANPERQIGPALSGQPIQQAQPQPVVQQPIVVQPTTTTADNSAKSVAPATAADNDKIEHEWVAAAKKVISDTKTDPHAQASAVADLMRDYVKKRYGREVGKDPEN